jgi:hypothetical protein
MAGAQSNSCRDSVAAAPKTGKGRRQIGFAMSDNPFDIEFRTTVMGDSNLISGQRNGAIVEAGRANTTPGRMLPHSRESHLAITFLA